jgi:hypothetical protein
MERVSRLLRRATSSGWTRLLRIAIFLFGLALDVRKNDRFVEPDITGMKLFDFGE